MGTVSAWEFVQKVEEIYKEKPAYVLGGDGKGGECDCIGMVRGALQRAGATDISHMRGTNDAARNAIQDLQPIVGDSQLKIGDVVLKIRNPDDPDYPLPERYRIGGSAYNGNLTNYTHIGTVTGKYPLEITHMTSPAPLKDRKLGSWSHVGKLPWVRYGEEEKKEVSAKPMVTWAENSSPINLRSGKSTTSAMLGQIPQGETVMADDTGDGWAWVHWQGRAGYVMSKFLKSETSGKTELSVEKLTEIYHELGMALGLE